MIKIILALLLTASFGWASTDSPAEFTLTPGTGSAGDHFASPSGSGNTCSDSVPCTLSTALSQATAGHSVILKNGTYTQRLTTQNNGTDGNYIWIKAQNNRQAILSTPTAIMLLINNNYIVVDGLYIDDIKTGISAGSGVKVEDGNHHVIIQNSTIFHAGNVGIRAEGNATSLTHHFIFRNNIIDGTGYKDTTGLRGEAILLGNNDSTGIIVQDVIIHGNLIKDFVSAGINVKQPVDRVWIRDNIFSEPVPTTAHGFSASDPSFSRYGIISIEGNDIHFFNNIIRDGDGADRALRVRNATDDTSSLIYNNVFVNLTNNVEAILCRSGNSGPVSQIFNNTFFNLGNHTVTQTACTPTIKNNMGIDGVTDNLAVASFNSTYFEDSSNLNFNLTALAVNAIDQVAGEPFSLLDQAGTAIFNSIKDFGAFEYVDNDPPYVPFQTVTDFFNRSDRPMDGIWSNGVFGTTGCAIVTETARNGTGGGSDYSCWVTTPIVEAYHEVFITLPNATSHNSNTNFRLMYCLDSSVGSASVNGYVLRFKKNVTSDFLAVERIDAGVYNTIDATFDIELDDGDKIGMIHTAAGEHDVYVDTGAGWTLLFSRTDSTYDCANSRVGLHVPSSTHWVDDFGHTGIVAGPPPSGLELLLGASPLMSD